MVAALAFVRAGMEVPPRTLVVGIPAKVMRELTPEELRWKGDATRQYQELAVRSLRTMRETTALTAVEPDRPRLQLADVLPLGAYKKGAGR
jgi:phenylacetic acid degradation protein